MAAGCGAAWACAAAGSPTSPLIPADQTSHINTSADQPAVKPVLERLLEASDAQAEAAGEPAPERRSRLLANIVASQNCFVNDPTPQQLAAISALYGGRNPSESMTRFAGRFVLNGSAWDGSGDAVTTNIGQARPIPNLTFSFPDDGIVWSAAGVTPIQLNQLNTRLDGRFGAAGRDYGHELFRQVLALWQRNCGIRYREVCDDNAALDTVPPPDTPVTRGDIRFGSYPLGRSVGLLAYNYPPEFGGDMVLNADYFTLNEYYSQGGANGYRYLRNAIAHEHGHGLGLRHVVPCNQTKLMEPFASTVYDTIQVDDRRGAQRSYGDRYAGNHTPQTAHELNEVYLIEPGSPPSDPRYPGTGFNDKVALPLDLVDMPTVSSPEVRFAPHSVFEANLSTNGPVGDINELISPSNPTGQDWFRFSVAMAELVMVRVTPTGGMYTSGPQAADPNNPNSSACAGPQVLIDASRAGNLNLQVYHVNDVSQELEGPLVSASEIAPGMPATGQVLLSTGTYLIRVFDSGNIAPLVDQPQLYDLEVRLGSEATMMAPDTRVRYAPIAVAGVDKVAHLDQLTQFIGDLASRVQENELPTAPLVARNYAWDLDGDGVFEINNAALMATPPGTTPINLRTPTITYTGHNRIIPVTLRITDANGKITTDTIFVRVVGEPVTVTSVDPVQGQQGTVVAVTITGSGLGAVNDVNQLAFGGANGNGITIFGSPVPSPDGTVLSGLFLAIDAAAMPGPRDLTIADGCTANTLPNAFTVMPAIPPPVNDGCAMALAWPPGVGCKPFNNVGAVTDPGQDYTGTPCAGSVIENDVWYTWVVPGLGVPMPFPLLRITPHPAGTNLTRVAVYRTGTPAACPSMPTQLISCGTSAAGRFDIAITPGETLLFRVGSLTLNDWGAGCVDLSFGEVLGACCGPGAACSVTFRSGCDARLPGVSFVPGGGCTPSSCPIAVGACCFVGGACTITSEPACSQLFLGVGSSCSPNSCPVTPSRCCFRTGDCQVLLRADCLNAGGTPFTSQSTCGSPSPCPQPTFRCCLTDGTCTVTTTDNCAAARGMLDMSATACPPVNTCPQPPPARCCLRDNSCQVVTPVLCSTLNGDFFGAEPACGPAGTCLNQPTVQACCLPGGICSLLTPQSCTAFGGVPVAGSTTCSGNPCMRNACCITATGACSLTTAAECPSSLGMYNPTQSVCVPSPCIEPMFACCKPTGECIMATPSGCAAVTGSLRAPGSTCAGTTCPLAQSRCCLPGAICMVLTSPQCTAAGGTFLVGSAACEGNAVCAQLTHQCCLPQGTCAMTTMLVCTQGGGVYTPTSQTCVAVVCPVQTGACCTTATGACVVGPATGCTSPGARFITGAACDVAICPNMGACCMGTGCIIAPLGSCGVGAAFGPGSTCSPINFTVCCPADFNHSGTVSLEDIFGYLAAYVVGDPAADFAPLNGLVDVQDLFSFLIAYFAGCQSNAVGACCAGSSCSILPAGSCMGAFNRYAGDGTVCNLAADPAHPCCRADFNQNGGVEVQDIFDFLIAYFNTDPLADFDGMGGVTLQDVFAFLQGYFSGCP